MVVLNVGLWYQIETSKEVNIYKGVLSRVFRAVKETARLDRVVMWMGPPKQHFRNSNLTHHDGFYRQHICPRSAFFYLEFCLSFNLDQKVRTFFVDGT
jgi:hypothetical protein